MVSRIRNSDIDECFVGRILVVDDDENNRLLLQRRVEMDGHEVITAEGGREALDLLEVREFDLILLDVMMPEISGLDVLMSVRNTSSPETLPVIMATAKDTSKDVARALTLGANDYIGKPLDMRVLLARIQTQLRALWFQRETERLGELREEFLSIASHDLKSPLSHILGYANLIRDTWTDRVDDESDLLNFIERIIGSTRTMQRLIEDFLDLQALEDGRLQLDIDSLDLNALVVETVRANAEAAKRKGLTLKTETNDEVPSIEFDRDRVVQVLQNLVDNAIKFSPSDRQIHVTTRIEDNHAWVAVLDQGPGLSPEDRKVAFEKYARPANKPTGGEKSSGLGLPICRFLVESHGGTIGVEANEAGGSTFWFKLPLTQESNGA